MCGPNVWPNLSRVGCGRCESSAERDAGACGVIVSDEDVINRRPHDDDDDDDVDIASPNPTPR